jgi:hypothetical protein
LFAAHVDQYIYRFADAGDNLEKFCDHEHSRYPFVAISSTLPATLHVSVSSLSSAIPADSFLSFPWTAWSRVPSTLCHVRLLPVSTHAPQCTHASCSVFCSTLTHHAVSASHILFHPLALNFTSDNVCTHLSPVIRP